jgi:hypothetical protein
MSGKSAQSHVPCACVLTSATHQLSRLLRCGQTSRRGVDASLPKSCFSHPQHHARSHCLSNCAHAHAHRLRAARCLMQAPAPQRHSIVPSTPQWIDLTAYTPHTGKVRGVGPACRRKQISNCHRFEPSWPGFRPRSMNRTQALQKMCIPALNSDHCCLWWCAGLLVRLEACVRAQECARDQPTGSERSVARQPHAAAVGRE